jgi:HK97 family phage portal protein
MTAAGWLREALCGVPVSSGVSVTMDVALAHVSVGACVSLLSDTVGMLPLPVYRRLGDGKARETHPVASLLNVAANTYQSGLAFRTLLTAHALVHGNGYANVERDAAGNPVALWPMTPTRVKPCLVQVNGVAIPVYDVTLPDGKQARLLGEDVLHVPAFSLDGLAGRSPVSAYREAIGSAVAIDRYAGKFFANNARPNGAIKVPGKLGDEAYKHMKESWDANYGGLTNAHRIALLEEGSEFTALATNNEDSQFIQTREFSVVEICRIFRVPPHMLYSLGRATWSNIEQLQIEFVTFSLMPWLRRWETEVTRKLLGTPDLFAEHNVDGLLRGDITTRYAAYAVARQWGWMSVNDCRAKENMNAIEGGDAYMQPMNMQAVGATTQPTTPATPAMRAALMPLVQDAAGRMIRREAGAIRKGNYDPQAHAAHMQAVLTPILQSLLAVEGRSGGEALALTIAADYVALPTGKLDTYEADRLPILIGMVESSIR